MNNVKFLHEPGYLHDLFFVFALHFNKDYFLSNEINFNKAAEDTEHFNKALAGFDEIPDELLPFFYMKDDAQCFMTHYYYTPYTQNLAETYNIKIVQAEISNVDRLTENLIQFYFGKLSNEDLVECKSSFSAVGKLIQKSNYNSAVKSGLYSFFLEPGQAVQRLSYELMTKGFELEQQYAKNYKRIADLQNQIDFEELLNYLNQSTGHKNDMSGIKNIFISVCLLCKNCIKINYNASGVLILLGMDYAAYLDYLINQSNLPELDVFGTALAEKNRVDILDLIYQKDEITIKDIEQELGFTGTNAYYHLSLMIKANMIKTRNRGRTVLYSINGGYFNAICDILSKYKT